MPAERNRHHSPIDIEVQRKVSRARLTQPEMFPLGRLLTRFIERGILFTQGCFGEKELALTQRAEGYYASRVGAFAQHSTPHLLFFGVRPETVG